MCELRDCMAEQQYVSQVLTIPRDIAGSVPLKIQKRRKSTRLSTVVYFQVILNRYISAVMNTARVL